MYRAMTAKYLGPTNYRGSRVVVWSDEDRLYVGWDSGLNSDDNYDMAVTRFCEKMKWYGTLVRGWQDDKHRVYVWTTHQYGQADVLVIKEREVKV